MTNKELIRAIPEGKKSGWNTTTETRDDKITRIHSRQERMGIDVDYGQGPAGYDQWKIKEPNGGGSVSFPYIKRGKNIYIGLNMVGRPFAGRIVPEVPRGFSLPKKTHEEAAKREFTEETGAKEDLVDRIHELGGKPINPNSTFFEANPQKGEGVKLFGIPVKNKEVETRRDSNDPKRRVYKFTPKIQGEIKEKNEKIKPEGIRFIHTDLASQTSDAFTLMAIARLNTYLSTRERGISRIHDEKLMNG